MKRTFVIAKSKVLAWLLISSLIVCPSLAQNQQSAAESERQRKCIELLEQISSDHQDKPASLGLSNAARAVLPIRLLDLSGISEPEISKQISRANRSDVLLVSDAILQSDATLNAIRSSPAIFSIKAPTGAPKQMEDMFRLPVFQPEVVVALPLDGKGVHNAFGTPEALAHPQIEYLNKVMPKFQTLKRVALTSAARAGSSIADTVLEKGNQSGDHSLFILVAHNRGGTLRFPDGSSLSVGQVYETLERSGRPGLILSCDTIQSSHVPTNSVLTNTPLDIASIANALAKMQKGIAATQSPVVADALRLLADSLYTAPPDVGPRVKILVYLAGGLILVLAGLYFWKCDEGGNCKN